MLCAAEAVAGVRSRFPMSFLAFTPSPAVAVGATTGAVPVPNLQETALIQRLRAHDGRALAQFETHYGPELKALIRRLVPDAGMAQDVWQECLLKLWRAFPQYEAGRGNMLRWAWYICRNVVIDELRAARWRDLCTMQPLELSAEARTQAAPADFRPEHIGLLALVDELCDDQRQVIDLMYRHHLTQVQTAERLCLPESTVKSRARAAYRVLRRLAA